MTRTELSSGMPPQTHEPGASSPPAPSDKPLLHRSVPRPVAVAAFCLLAVAVPTVYFVRTATQEARLGQAYLPELEAAARNRSSDARLMTLLGGRYAEAGDYPRAASAFEQAVGAGERENVVFEGWAAAHAASGDTQKAKAVLEWSLQEGRCQPQQACRRALSRLNDAATQPASTSITIAEAISPGGPSQIVTRFASPGSWASLWVRDGFARREAEARAKPYDLTAQLRWADALRQNRRLHDAESVALTLTKRFPKSPDAHITLGDILLEGGIRAKAGIQYKAALALRPDDVHALKGLGRVGVEMEIYRLAIDNYEKATKAAPNDADAWIGLGRGYLNEQFQFERAAKAFETAARLAPDRTDFFPYYSDALNSLYRADEAEQLLTRRLQAAPNDARTHYLIARLMLKNKVTPERTRQAEEHLRTSLKLEPNAPAVRVALAQALLDKGDPQQAADAGILLAEANEQDPLDPLTMRLLAVAYRRIGRLDRAKEAEAQAKRLADYKAKVSELEDRERSNPRDITIHERLAALYASGGETDKAAKQQEMAFMLRRYPKAAQAGVTALTRAVTKTGQVDTDTRK